MVVKYITLFYDSYEKRFGDGFYPCAKYVKGWDSIIIGFKLIDGCWQQVTGDRITGYDGNARDEILQLLNDSQVENNGPNKRLKLN